MRIWWNWLILNAFSETGGTKSEIFKSAQIYIKTNI